MRKLEISEGVAKKESRMATNGISIERVQNEPPQNMPLWHVDYFEQKAIKTQEIQEKLYLFLNYIK